MTLFDPLDPGHLAAGSEICCLLTAEVKFVRCMGDETRVWPSPHQVHTGVLGHQGWPASLFTACWTFSIEGWASRPYVEVFKELHAAPGPCSTSISSAARFSPASPMRQLAWAQDSAALWAEIKGFTREWWCRSLRLVSNQKDTTHQQVLLTGCTGSWVPSYFLLPML